MADHAEYEFMFAQEWPLPIAVQTACVLEVTAPKAGNVHPAAAFDDMDFDSFVTSSVAIRDSFCDLQGKSVGSLVLSAVEAMQKSVGRNTNLGTILLFAPIAKATELDSDGDMRASIETVLAGLTAEDSRCVYEAIRHANPGGMGSRGKHDVGDEAPSDLLAAMRQVADLDAVARQYTNGFSDVFDHLLPWFDDELVNGIDILDSICRLQVRWLAHDLDGLIVRKVGVQVATKARDLARVACQQLDAFAGPVVDLDAYQRLDDYLRANGNRRNPGTTADLIAATLLLKLVLK